MRIYVYPASFDVSPLECPPREVLLLDRSLGETMDRDLGAAGLDIVRVASLTEAEERARGEASGALLILDSVLCSPTVIRRFLARARASGGDAALVCALPRAVGTDNLSHVGGLEARDHEGQAVWTAPFYFLRGRGAVANAAPALQPYRETLQRFPVPFGILGRPGETLTVALGESYMCSVSHWVHVLRANTAAMGGWWVRRLRFGYLLGPAWLLWRFVCGFPWWGGRLLESIRWVSLRARVDHNATVAASVVKRGVTIGAHASVRNSFVDEGATIGDGACVSGCVIGKGAYVAPNSVVSLSVVGPGAMAGQLLMQASLLARNAAAFTNSNFYDLNMTRNVRVLHRGKLADSGTQMLGVCVGPEARVSAGVWVASGREVPAGAVLIKPPSEIASEMGKPAKGEPHVVVMGAVKPLGQRA